MSKGFVSFLIVFGFFAALGALLVWDDRNGGHIINYIEARVDTSGASDGRRVNRYKIIGDLAGEAKYSTSKSSGSLLTPQVKIHPESTVLGTWKVGDTDKQLVVRINDTFEQGLVLEKAEALTPDGVRYSYRVSCIAEGTFHFDGVYLRPRILKLREVKYEDIKLLPFTDSTAELPEAKELAPKMPGYIGQDIQGTIKTLRLGGTVTLLGKEGADGITMDPGTGPVRYTRTSDSAVYGSRE